MRNEGYKKSVSSCLALQFCLAGWRHPTSNTIRPFSSSMETGTFSQTMSRPFDIDLQGGGISTMSL